MPKMPLRAAALFAVLTMSLAILAGAALAASPATFTTDSTGSSVNKNHYVNKCDVYLNGGPTGAALPDGSWTFGVLAPGGQADPNGSNLLSTDSNANRTFTTSGGNVSYGGTHTTSTDTVTGKTLIDLCDYNDTPNPGGVYIAFICDASNMTPSGCKYDAFKVTGSSPPPGGSDLTGIKTANGAFTRSYSWTTQKDANPTYVQTSNNTVSVAYSVTVTKSAPTDSGFMVTGTVTVFNSNDDTVTGVSVTDAIGSTACIVTGGSSSIAGGSSATFDYTCSLTGVTASSTGTNTATISWDKSSINSPNNMATATADFDFTADPTVVGDCTTVSDTLKGSLGTVCATHTFNYSLTLNVPATGCTTYNNTASETTSGTSDSASVEVCRTNSNGFTIGFWQNKNGQNYIRSNCTTLRTKVASYSNVFSSVPACTTPFQNYVLSIIGAANASGDGVAMFKAQMLATALNVGRTSSLGTTSVVVPTSIDADGCATVNEVLASANTYYGTAAADSTITSAERAQLLVYKDVFDAVNNDNAVTC